MLQQSHLRVGLRKNLTRSPPADCHLPDFFPSTGELNVILKLLFTSKEQKYSFLLFYRSLFRIQKIFFITSPCIYLWTVLMIIKSELLNPKMKRALLVLF